MGSVPIAQGKEFPIFRACGLCRPPLTPCPVRCSFAFASRVGITVAEFSVGEGPPIHTLIADLGIAKNSFPKGLPGLRRFQLIR